jgi:hypothetical protein
MVPLPAFEGARGPSSDGRRPEFDPADPDIRSLPLAALALAVALASRCHGHCSELALRGGARAPQCQ